VTSRVALHTVCLVAVAVVIGLAVGAVPMALGTIIDTLRGPGDPVARAILWDLRLPRVSLGLVVGAGLAVSGGAMQATLRNPLAEPYLLGVSGGAAVGAVLATAAGVLAPTLTPLAAFVGAMGAVALVLAVARAAGGASDPRILVMAGVIVGAFCTAAIMVALATAPEGTVRGALWWMMGSLADATWSDVRWVGGYVALGGGLLLWWGRDLDVLALGEEPAAALGLDVDRVTRRLFLVAALVAAATVSGAGLIGFVGLVVPSLVRTLGVTRVRPALAVSAGIGGALVVLADAVARRAVTPAELPLGAVTALLGVPFFVWRLRAAAAR